MTETLLPYDLDAEAAVLGSLLIERDALLAVAPLLAPGDFYSPDYERIYAAMLALFQRRVNPDWITLMAELRKRPDDSVGATTDQELLMLIDGLRHGEVTAVFAEDYARIVKDASVRRQHIQAADRIARAAVATTDASELAQVSADALSRIQLASDDGFVPLSEGLSRTFDALDAPKVPPLLTGFRPLDEATGGLHAGELVIVAARPSTGKSALMCQLTLGMAQRGRKVAVVSLEMAAEELQWRWVGLLSRVNIHRYRIRRQLDERNAADEREDELVADAFGKLAQVPIRIDDDPANSKLPTLVARATQAFHKQPYDCLAIDHMHLMDTPGGRENRTQELSTISRGLKLFARQLNVPIVVLAQLNRAIEQRGGDAMPRLSDLRESGSIEQDADVVLFPHRPGALDASKDQSEAYLIVAKQRNGPTGTQRLYWSAETMQFHPLHGGQP